MSAAIGELTPIVGVKAACEALNIPRASFYRKRGLGVFPAAAAVRLIPRALDSAEREAVLACLHEERFQNCAPAAVYATLLDEGRYHCSIRTMYRILEGEGEARERRDQLVHPAYQKPELLATGPNQLWSWDITKLLGPAKWTYFYLYVILDVFSRYVVGWMVADGESAELAKRLIADTCAKQEIEPGKLTIHADRGSSMTSKPVAFLMADLGITKTHSRPHVSDDNPYSESHFRTLKYRPGFPERFGSLQDARCFSQEFFPGTTKSIVIPDWAFSPRPWFIMVLHPPPSNSAAPFWMPPTWLIPNASFANRRNRFRRQRRSGSISQNRQRIKLSKLCFLVSQTC